MWRPEDWDALDIYATIESISTTGIDYIEAGADGILSALFKLAEESPTKTFTIDSRIINIYKERK